jgi:hypothetical protein
VEGKVSQQPGVFHFYFSFFRGKVVRRQMGKWGRQTGKWGKRGGGVTHEGNTEEERRSVTSSLNEMSKLGNRVVVRWRRY